MSEAEATVPPKGLAGVARRVDDVVLRVEQAFVTLAALVMTGSVTLDIVYRAFATGESVLARKLQTVFGLFGVERTESGYLFLRDYGTPGILITLTFLVGWAMYGSGQRRKDLPASKPIGMLWGAAAVGIAYGFVQFVLRAPSTWVCGTLMVGGCLAFAVWAAQRQEWTSVVLAVLVGAAGAWGASKLPAQYIWSQELSLILLAWMAFIGGSMATRMQRHIQVDALSRILPKSFRPWTRALGLAVTCVFCLYMTWLSYEHVFGPTGDIASGELRPATRIPAWTIIFSAVVAFALMSVRFFGLAVDAFLNPQIPEQRLDH